MFRSFCLVFALLLLGLSPAAFAASASGPAVPEYGAPLDISALSGGQHFSQATGVNNFGLICGSSSTSDFSTHAFVYNPAASGLQDLGTLPGGFSSEAGAVNDSGQVVGDAGTASGESHLFSWDSASGMKDLGSPAGSVGVGAAGVNASGQICGNFRPSSGPTASHAYVYSGGAFHDLGVPSGYVSSVATGINASGQTCGTVSDNAFANVAFIHSGTGPLTSADLLPLPSGYVQNHAYGISNAGRVVGSLTDADNRAVGFVSSGGATQVVSAGALYGVNNVGVAVGSGFLYNIAAQAVQDGPSVCAAPAALNDRSDSVGSQVAGHHYTHACFDTTDIGALPGGSDSVPDSINAAGQTAGASRTDGSHSHAVLYDGQGLHDLGTLRTVTSPANAVTSQAYAINAGGQIAGYSFTLYGSFHAFLYDAAHGMRDIGTLNGKSDQSYAFGLNDLGQATGYSDSRSGATHAFLYDGNAFSMKDLGTLPGGTTSYGQAINNAGQVVGQSDRADGRFDAFSYTAAGGMKDLGTLPGGTTSYANAVNASGQVAGFSDMTGGETHAFLYTAAGGMQDLGTLPGGTNSVATGLNARGQVVGHADTAAGRETAFVWDLAHGMRDLNALLTPGAGFTLTRANAINDRGQITGYGVNASGQTHGFVLTPFSLNHLLWTAPDGRAVLWSVNPDGTFGDKGAYGPYTDAGGTWRAGAVATGPDGVSRLLWTHPDGRAVLWSISPDGTYTDKGAYGPYADAGGTWRASAVSVGPDNVAHLLWTAPDGRAVLWFVNPDGAFGDNGAYGPYADSGGTWKAGAVATGADGVSHLLWTNPDGRAVLWFVNPGGAFGDKGAVGPYTDAGGTWRAGAASAGP